VRGILLGWSARQKHQSVLEPVSVGDGPDEHTARLQHAGNFCDNVVWETRVLEDLAGDDDVERVVVERERLLHVGPHGRDASGFGPLQCLGIDIETNHLVSVEEVLCYRARAATEIQHTPSWAPDGLDEERKSLGHEHELSVVTTGYVVLSIQGRKTTVHALGL
jgi:hypothetical protein